MKRRSRAGGKSSKRTTLPRRRSAPTSARGHRSAVTRQETHVARLTRERDEALEQQAATSEILHVISNSPTNVQIAFNAIARSAARLCEAFDVVVYSVDGSVLRLVAHHGPMPAGDVPLHRGTVGGRTVIEGRLIHTRDLQAEVNEFPEGSAIARERGHRTNLSVPMLRGGVAIGNIQVRRQEVRPFSAKQISVLKTFADQAVIAVENSRLLNELRQRTTDLTEALDQQTATSEVLKVISNSPGDLVPVFESLLANAKHLCGAKFGTLLLREGNAFRTGAMHGATKKYTEARRHAPLIRPATDTGLGRVLKTKQAVQIADINEVPGYVANPMQAPIVHLAGARTMLSVPMLKEEELIGVIEIYRQEVLPFSSKQVELVKNFAAQAVIAIENARLLTELRQRTDDLGDALEQQTATSEVLRVISNSLSDTQPVFESIVRNGVTLFSEAAVSIALVDNDMVKAAAVAHRDPARAEAWRSVFPFPLTREYMHSKAILDGKMLDIPDGERASVDLTVGAKNFLRSGYRAVTIVPLMRGDQAIGALSGSPCRSRPALRQATCHTKDVR